MQQTNALSTLISRRMRRIVIMLATGGILGLIVMFGLSGVRMQDRQFNTWIKWAPEALLSTLVESDDFSASNYIRSVQSSHLFSSFRVFDINGRLVGGFGRPTESSRVDVRDKNGTLWGHIEYRRDYDELIMLGALALIVVSVFVVLAMQLGFRSVHKEISIELNPLNALIDKLSIVFDELSALTIDRDPSDLLKSHSVEALSTQEETISKLFSKVALELSNYRKKVENFTIERERLKRDENFAGIARQVAHDIRSPLTAMRILSQTLSKEIRSDKVELLNSAIKRIDEISDDLISNGLGSQRMETSTDVRQAIKQIVEEKRVQHSTNPNLSIDFTDHTSDGDLTVIANSVEFSRVLSNLVNNSIEAVNLQGKVNVDLSSDNEAVYLKVVDNGPGFPQHLLDRLFTKGMTFNKPNGNGLGLFHAREAVALWNGQITAGNNLVGGAHIALRLRRSNSSRGQNV